MKKLLLLPVAALSLTMGGCASIVSGTDQTVTFDSSPDGARVTVSGRAVGVTPVSVTIDRDSNQVLTLEKEGYKTHTSKLTTSTNPWLFGNLLFGGLPGTTTDSLNGAVHKYSPDAYFVTMTPEKGDATSASDSRKIKEMVLSFGDEIRKELAAGGGESTNAIIEVLQIIDVERQSTIVALGALAEQSENNLVFANNIIEFYEVE